MSAAVAPRAEVGRFAEEMERKLAANDHKGGWDDMEIPWLLGRARQEMRELTRACKRLEALEDGLRGDRAVRDEGWVERTRAAFDKAEAEVIAEAADVANMVMMVADLMARRRGQ